MRNGNQVVLSVAKKRGFHEYAKDQFGTANVDYVFLADTHKQTPEQWGESIYEGELLVQTNWEKKRTEVMHPIK